MKIRIDRTRMAIRGCFYAYHVTVPLQPGDDRSYTIRREDGSYLTFTAATLPKDHNKMPVGWERYEAFLAHEKLAEAEAWKLVQEAFPETQGHPLSTLWMEVPGFDARHETKWVERRES